MINDEFIDLVNSFNKLNKSIREDTNSRLQAEIKGMPVSLVKHY